MSVTLYISEFGTFENISLSQAMSILEKYFEICKIGCITPKWFSIQPTERD